MTFREKMNLQILASLIALAFLTSCSEDPILQSKNQKPNQNLPSAEAEVFPLPKRENLGARYMIEAFYKIGEGIVALEKAYYPSPDAPPNKTIAYLRPEGNGFNSEVGPIAEGTFVSNLLVNGNTFQIVAMNPSVTTLGELNVAYEFKKMNWTNTAAQLSVLHSEFRINSDTRPSKDPSKDPLAIRNHERQDYEKILLLPSREYSPVLFLQDNRPGFTIHNEFETSIYSIEDSKISEIFPVDNHISPEQIFCTGSSTPTILLAGNKETLKHRFPEISNQLSPDVVLYSLFRIEKEGLLTILAHHTEPKMTKLSPSTCHWDGETLYIGGAIRESLDATNFSKATAWKITADKITKIFLDLPQNSFVSAIHVGEKGQVYLAGSCNFTQARLGSTSFMNGFVSEYQPDLRHRWTQILKAPKTTRVYALYSKTNQKSTRLLVGGQTLARSTHEGDDSSSSFVHPLEIVNQE